MLSFLLWLAVVIFVLSIYFLIRPYFFKHEPLKDISGYAFFVTGAASGIGAEIVSRLLRRGCFVFAADINLPRLEELYKKQANIRLIQLDVTKQEEVTKAAEIVKNENRGLFGLVNCAGITSAHRGIWPPLSLTEGTVEQDAYPVFQVNTFGLMRTTIAMMPFLYSTGEKLNKPSVRPRIINIASIAGRLGAGFWGYYPSSKFAVVGYTDSLRKEMRHLGIRVDCIEPGFVETPLLTPIIQGEVNSTPASSEPYSIKLFEVRKRTLAKGKKLLMERKPQPVSRVADIITEIALSSSIQGGHYPIDYISRVFLYRLLTYFPVTITDFLEANL